MCIMQDETMIIMAPVFQKNMHRAYTLQHLGINGVAWSYDDVFTIMDQLVQQQYVILGGDVYRMDEHVLEITYDSWFVEKELYTRANGVVASQAKTIDYITKYHARNGYHYYLLVVAAVVGVERQGGWTVVKNEL